MENSISSDLIRGHIDAIILYSLIDGDKHAQQISDYVAQKSEKKYILNQATLYSSLKRLEKEKLVKPYWNEAEGGRRRFFNITETGKSFVDDNLLNWNFSRSIIDKLLGAEPSEKISVISTDHNISENNLKETIDNSIKINVNGQVFTQQSIDFNKIPGNQQKIDEDVLNKRIEAKKLLYYSPIKKEKEDNTEIETKDTFDTKKNENEINFRNILNGLIKGSNVYNDDSVVVEEKVEQSDEKENLLDVIEQKNESPTVFSKRNFDFGDLETNAVKEGYKIRFSTSNIEKEGKILSSKLNMFSSFFVSLFMLLQFFTIILSTKGTISFSLIAIVFPIIFCLAPSIILSIFYFNKPKKTKKHYKLNDVFTMLIVLFDFLLLEFVIEWLFGIDFSNIYMLIVYFVFPALIMFDVFSFVLFRYFLSKSNNFIIS